MPTVKPRFNLCENGSLAKAPEDLPSLRLSASAAKSILRFFPTVLLLLNLNTATIQQLDALPGIGPVLAHRIVEFREKRGGFRRVEELLAVPGISERRWQTLRTLVEVGKLRDDSANSGVRSGRSGA